jgi:hypothetical protein
MAEVAGSGLMIASDTKDKTLAENTVHLLSM